MGFILSNTDFMGGQIRPTTFFCAGEYTLILYIQKILLTFDDCMHGQ